MLLSRPSISERKASMLRTTLGTVVLTATREVFPLKTAGNRPNIRRAMPLC